MEEKIKVLLKIAKAFQNENILWAVGGSMMLYFYDIVTTCHDIDLCVNKKDALRAEKILNRMGKQIPTQENPSFRSTCFRKYEIDGVKVDLLGGFGIIQNGKYYDCDIQTKQITTIIKLSDQQIPLCALEVWLNYYKRMDRQDKVELIRGRM